MSKELRDALSEIIKKPRASKKLHAVIDALEKEAAHDHDDFEQPGECLDSLLVHFIDIVATYSG